MLVIPVFVPHAGCPNDCCFCNQKIISGSQKAPSAEEIESKIEIYRKAAGRFDETQIAFYGGSFTAIEPELQEKYLETVQKYLKINGGFADKIRLSTRPDAIDETVIERLLHYNVRIVELGAQSMDDNVLRLSNRGHSAADTVRASEMLKKAGIILGLQTMQGLPGADFDGDIRTAEKICGIGPDFVRIYPTVVLKHSRLGRDYESGVYRAMPLKRMVELCGRLAEMYVERGIKIIRMGLQTTETISNESENSDIIGGPYHEAFGQLVKDYLLEQEVAGVAECAKTKAGDRLPVHLNIITEKARISDIYGYKKENLNFFRGLGFKKIHVSADTESALPLNDGLSGNKAVRISNEYITEISWNQTNEKPEGEPAYNLTMRVSFSELL